METKTNDESLEPTLTTYEVECPDCGAVLEILDGEVIECPDCGELIDDAGWSIF